MTKRICVSMKWFLRLLLSGGSAFGVLTLFGMVYCNTALYEKNMDGCTDYVWPPYTIFSKYTEGGATGRVNNEGYNNLFDYTENDVDVLVMGSSHMEGIQVAQEEITSDRLNMLLDNKVVYNIGVAGHDFIMCCNHFETAIKKYKPSYVVIETFSCSFTDESLENVVNGTYREFVPYSKRLLAFKRNPVIKHWVSQARAFWEKKVEVYTEEETADQAIAICNSELLTKLMQNLSDVAREHRSQIIIVYHPATMISTDGSLKMIGNNDAVAQFAEACEKCGIRFLDMSERFSKEYEDNYILPYGFCNTPVGSGHLNKWGHAMIADELYKIISEVE